MCPQNQYIPPGPPISDNQFRFHSSDDQSQQNEEIIIFEDQLSILSHIPIDRYISQVIERTGIKYTVSKIIHYSEMSTLIQIIAESNKQTHHYDIYHRKVLKISETSQKQRDILKFMESDIPVSGPDWLLLNHYSHDLSKLIRQSPCGLDTKLLATIIIQIGQALQILHYNGYIHGDIAPKNILCRNIEQPETMGDNNYHFHLCDFGNSFTIDKVPQNATQTFSYRAPEWISQQSITPKIDVWGLGCIIFECLTGQLLIPFPEQPLQSQSEDLLYQQLVQSFLTPDSISKRLFRFSTMTKIKRWKPFLDKILVQKIEQRINLQELLILLKHLQ